MMLPVALVLVSVSLSSEAAPATSSVPLLVIAPCAELDAPSNRGAALQLHRVVEHDGALVGDVRRVHRDGVQRQRRRLDRHRATVERGAAVDLAVAGDVDRAVASMGR